MNKIKSNVNLLIAIFTVFLTVLNIITYIADYIYRPKSYILFLVIYLVICGVFTFFSVKYKKIASEVSRKIAPFMTIITFVYLITLIFCFDFKIDYETYDIFYYELLFAISAASSLILFFVYNRVKWLSICMAVMSGIFAFFFSIILFFSMLLVNFGSNTILKTLNSPDNTYVAWVVSSNHGALGGATSVRVRNIKRDIPLVSGMLKTKSQDLYSDAWAAEIELVWEDNDTILINDERYDVK